MVACLVNICLFQNMQYKFLNEHDVCEHHHMYNFASSRDLRVVPRGLGDTLRSKTTASPDSLQLCIYCCSVWGPLSPHPCLPPWSQDPRCRGTELLGPPFSTWLACTCKHLVPAGHNVPHPFKFTFLHTIGRASLQYYECVKPF